MMHRRDSFILSMQSTKIVNTLLIAVFHHYCGTLCTHLHHILPRRSTCSPKPCSRMNRRLRTHAGKWAFCLSEPTTFLIMLIPYLMRSATTCIWITRSNAAAAHRSSQDDKWLFQSEIPLSDNSEKFIPKS